MDAASFVATVVQSSATIFAIVAGLLTVSVLNTASNRDAVIREIESVHAHRTVLQNGIVELSEERDRTRFNWVFSASHFSITTLLADLKSMSLDQLQLKYDAQDIDAERFATYMENLASPLQRHLEWLETNISQHGIKPYTFDEWINEHSVMTTDVDRDIAALIFQELVRQEIQRHKEERERSGAHDPYSWLKGESLLLESETMHIHKQQMLENEKQRHWDEIADIESRRRDTEDQLRIRESDLIHLKSMLLRSANIPSDIRSGLTLLACLALIGIIAPLTLAEWLGPDLSRSERLMILSTLAIGLIGMFTYLLWLVWPRPAAVSADQLEAPHRPQV